MHLHNRADGFAYAKGDADSRKSGYAWVFLDSVRHFQTPT
jgi:hypothetical protein